MVSDQNKHTRQCCSKLPIIVNKCKTLNNTLSKLYYIYPFRVIYAIYGCHAILLHSFWFLISFIIISSVISVQSLMFCGHISLCLLCNFIPSILLITILVNISFPQIKCAKYIHFAFPILFIKQIFLKIVLISFFVSN